MGIRMNVTGREKFREVALRLKSESTAPIIRSESANELNTAAPPVLAAVQAKVRTASFPASPSRGGESPNGLREHLADSTIASRFATGVRFAVADPRGQTLAKYTEGLDHYKRWRHPVFGNRNAWVQQRADPWFFPTIKSKKPLFAGAMERAVRQIVQRLGG